MLFYSEIRQRKCYIPLKKGITMVFSNFWLLHKDILAFSHYHTVPCLFVGSCYTRDWNKLWEWTTTECKQEWISGAVCLSRRRFPSHSGSPQGLRSCSKVSHLRGEFLMLFVAIKPFSWPSKIYQFVWNELIDRIEEKSERRYPQDMREFSFGFFHSWWDSVSFCGYKTSKERHQQSFKTRFVASRTRSSFDVTNAFLTPFSLLLHQQQVQQEYLS